MFPHVRSSVTFVALLGVLGGAFAADEPRSREEIAKRGKAATALVEIKPRHASAFCVHPSGLFVTNEHVIREGGSSPINLILDAGTKTQRVFRASVIRSDKGLDLALLRVEGKVELPALTLGSDENLTELQEIIVCGFPFGKALALEEGEYPTISINAGSVTALRRGKDDTLFRIQLDAALNPGNSGGPVLDRHGKVVGVVVSGVQGSGVNMAIPVNHVSRFLAGPEIVFTPPKESKVNQEVVFEATAVSVLPAPAPLELELVLSSFAGKERRFPMMGFKGSYHTKAVPFPEIKEPLVLRLHVKYEDGAVSGLAEDQTFRLGEHTVKLSQVLRLRLGAKTEAELTDRRKITGGLSDLDVLPVKVGGQPLRLNLAGASQLDVDPSDAMTAVSCTVIARQEGKEVGRVGAPLYLQGAVQASIEAVREGRFIRPPRSAVPVSYLRAVSSPGDYIGQGRSYSFGGDEFVVRRSDRGVQITVGDWRILFGAPRGRFLEVAEYLDAKRYSFSDESPGIDFSGYGRGANRIAGKFVVWELEVKGNQVLRLAVDFILHCEETMPPLYGMIRFNSSFY